MMQRGSHYQAYSAATQTVAKTRQIVMLYDGIVRFLQQRHDAASGQRVEERCYALSRATDIIDALHNCLDFEQGGEVAQSLSGFYTRLHMDLMAADRVRDSARMEAIIERVRRMRNLWDEIDKSEDSVGFNRQILDISGIEDGNSSLEVSV